MRPLWASKGSQPQMWIQTQQPEHPLYQALLHHDYPGFAQQQLHERQQAGMPPFVFQALVRADAKTQDAAQNFLHAAASTPRKPACTGRRIPLPTHPHGRATGGEFERAQMLIEAASRSALQKFRTPGNPCCTPSKKQHKSVVRWLVDVDPQSV